LSAGDTPLRRLAWFAALWIAGVTGVMAVAFVLRAAMRLT